MKITGEMLKSERINKKLSVQDVAASLKLSSKIITAIEAGNLDELPAKTFVRGFVKSYAQLLGLDAHLVLRQFQEEMGSTNPLPKVPPPAPVASDNKIRAARPTLKHTAKSQSSKNTTTPPTNLNNENPKKVFLMISIAVILIIILVVSNKIIENYKANPVAINTTEDLKTATAAPTSDENANVETSDQVTQKNDVTSSDSTTAEQATSPQKLEDGFEKSSGKPIEVLLEAKKDTELQYAKGDSLLFIPLKLSANQIQIIRSKVGLYLKAPDASALKISVNGVEKYSTNSNNKAIKLTF